jgi:hypothetical protein
MLRVHMGWPSRTTPLMVLLCASLAGTASGAEPGGTATPPELEVRLSLSAGAIAPGQEVRATVILVNRGPAAMAVLEDTVLVGAHLAVAGPDGTPVPLERGLRPFTVKPGLYLGRAERLPPGGRHSLHFALYLDGRRRLFCTALEKPGHLAPETAALLGLPAGFPARYLEAGQILPVKARGTYRIAYRVEQGQADRSWRLSEAGPAGWADLLWLGIAESQPVELSLP